MPTHWSSTSTDLRLAGSTSNSDAAGSNASVSMSLRSIGPGYGRSDFHRFTLGSVAEDAFAVAMALGYERFAVVGFSAGSAAAAAAAIYPDRITALGIVGGAAPFPEVPDELAKLSAAERRALELIDDDEHEAERLLAEPDRVFVDVLEGDDAAVTALWRSVSPPADAALLADVGVATLVTATHRESLRQGQRGWARDNVVRMSSWHVDLSRITAAPWFWYGDEDAVANGTWLKNQIPHGQLVVLSGEGHWSVLHHEWINIMRRCSRAS